MASAVESAGGHAVTVTCDVTSDESVAAAFAKARQVGKIEVLIFNAAPPYPPGTSLKQSNLPKPHELDPKFLQQSFDIGVTGCVRCAKQVVPDMLAAKEGTILLTGATQALRGHGDFASMSPIKFALRSLGQSMSREYGPQGVHVAHVIIDGAIDSPGMRTVAVQNDRKLLLPADIAEQYVMLTKQPASTWTYELQLSPPGGDWGMRI